jgi:hypothetical protein
MLSKEMNTTFDELYNLKEGLELDLPPRNPQVAAKIPRETRLLSRLLKVTEDLVRRHLDDLNSTIAELGPLVNRQPELLIALPVLTRAVDLPAEPMMGYVPFIEYTNEGPNVYYPKNRRGDFIERQILHDDSRPYLFKSVLSSYYNELSRRIRTIRDLLLNRGYLDDNKFDTRKFASDTLGLLKEIRPIVNIRSIKALRQQAKQVLRVKENVEFEKDPPFDRHLIAQAKMLRLVSSCMVSAFNSRSKLRSRKARDRRIKS